MNMERIHNLRIDEVYPLLLQKVTRKGRTKQELDTIIMWMTSYTQDDLDTLLTKPITYKAFFKDAPQLNERRFLVKGKICGVDIAGIEDDLYKEIRILDKLVDELAKGKALEKIMR